MHQVTDADRIETLEKRLALMELNFKTILQKHISLLTVIDAMLSKMEEWEAIETAQKEAVFVERTFGRLDS